LISDFSFVFLAAVLLTLALRLWLGARQMRCVAAHRAAVPAVFADRIPLAAHQKAADYTIARCRAAFAETLIDTGLLFLLTLGGGIAWLHELWAARLDGIPYGLMMIFSVILVYSLLDLPFALYRQFVIEVRYGFNRMTPALFFVDLAKQALLGLVIGAPVIAAALWLMAAAGALWWFWLWLLWAVFNVLLLFIYPVWIAPLFNRFTPLAEGEMRRRIEALLDRCGFRSSGLFVIDGSKRSSHGNAYFTGFGDNKRIVFFDTLLERLTPAEAEAVLAHELGHFRKKHIVKRIAFMFAASLALLWLLGRLIDSPWFYAGLGVPAANTALALILFFLVVPVFGFLLSPLFSALSRRHEFEADAYAAEQTAADDLARALVKLYEDNAATLTPDPLYSAFYASHPPAAERIAHLQALT
jgi:STE24 endopeptidase